LGGLGSGTDKYIRSKREGRGDNPQITDDVKKIIAQELIPDYQFLLKNRDLIDWNQLRDRTFSNMRAMSYQRYPILVVDEAQDLSALQIHITLRLVSPETKSITFIRDSTQRIYKANYIWNDVGLTFGIGSELCLEKNYRNTREIAEVAASLMQHEPDQSDIDILDPSLTTKHGPKPTWIQGKYTQQKQFLAERIQGLDIAQESVGVFHIRRNDVSGLASYLRSKGLECVVFSEEEDSTNIQSAQGIFLSTLHSAKGLEFDHVFIVGYDDFFAPGPNRMPHRTTSAHVSSHRKLLYTAITRTQKTLTITSSTQEHSRFLQEIDPELLNIIRV
jgi:superfamily I DNA/RNA helicase